MSWSYELWIGGACALGVVVGTVVDHVAPTWGIPVSVATTAVAVRVVAEAKSIIDQEG